LETNGFKHGDGWHDVNVVARVVVVVEVVIVVVVLLPFLAIARFGI